MAGWSWKKYKERFQNGYANGMQANNLPKFTYEFDSVDKYMGAFTPFVCGDNFVELFNGISEIQYPVRYIADRVAKGRFLLKSIEDDSVVWDREPVNKFLEQPNPEMTFQEFIALYASYYLLLGKSFIAANTPDSLLRLPRWESTNSYYVLPAQMVSAKFNQGYVPFSGLSVEDLIEFYSVDAFKMKFDPRHVLHQKDLTLSWNNISEYLGKSRLHGVSKPISNLLAVYEARNVIYTRRGAMGLIVSKKVDESGSVPLTKSEKQQIMDDYQRTYGVTGGKSTTAISNVPVEFLNIGMSIKDMEPFRETLNDAIQICAIYGLKEDIVPREDHSTFSNQNAAEVSAYEGPVITLAEKIAQSLTNFLGLKQSGLYLEATFNHIPVLQPNHKEEAETEFRITENCRIQFWSGTITLNDWRVKLGRENIENPIYDKTILEMEDNEIDYVKNILGNG